MRAAAVVLALAAVSGGACAGPPWFMGKPLNGQQSISPQSARLSWVEQREAATRARATGQVVLEIAALLALDEAAHLRSGEAGRLASLLVLRAADFHARGRPIPENRDLRIVARLEAGMAPAEVARLRAGTETAAGDAWLGVGSLPEATEAYQQAAALGAPVIDIRLQAAAGLPPPPTATLPELEQAIAVLPLRAVPFSASSYLERGGSDRATLARALWAARQEGMTALAARLTAALTPPAPPPAAEGEPADDADAEADADVRAAGSEVIPPVALPSPAPPPPLPPKLDDWVLGGPSLSARLLPLVATHPEILDGGPRARRWVDLLLVEDPTSPDVLELAALVFGRAGRNGGTDRMLMELTYYTPDRAAGLARGAAVWERLGRAREACAQWIRAARWRDDPEDAFWRNAVSCTRRDPGAGDWRAIRQYVLDRAPPARRQAIAASLDAVLPVEGGVSRAAENRQDAKDAKPGL